MNINEEFPTKYLKASDLGGNVAKVQIAHVDSEQIGKDKDRRLVLYFRGKQKGMVLNKTNARAIADVFGDETDNWTGGDIEVFSMKVEYQGRMVDGLRIRIPQQPRQAPTVRAPAVQTGGIPFVANGRDDARVRAGQPDTRLDANPPAPPVVGSAPYDDEIPFAPEWR